MFESRLTKRSSCLLVMVGLLAVLHGCGGSSNKLLSNIDSSEAQSPAASREEVLSLVRSETQRGKALADDLIAALNSATNDASANAALTKIEELISDFKANTPKRTLVVEMTDAEYRELQQDMKRVEDEATGSLEGHKQRAEQAGMQIGMNPSISMGTKMKFRTSMMGLQILSMQGTLRLGRRYPRDQVVTVVIEGPAEAGEFAQYMDEQYDMEMVRATFKNGVHEIRFAAVPDLDEFASRINLGTVVETSSRTRGILVSLSESELDTLRDARARRIAEEERLAKERAEKAEADRIADEKEREHQATSRVQAVIAERDEAIETTLRTLKRITNIQGMQDSTSTIEGVRRSLRSAEDRIEYEKKRFAREMGRDYEYQESAQAVMADIQKEIDRLNQDPMTRIALMRSFGQNVDAHSLLHGEKPFRGYANPGQDSSHPDYFLANLLDLKHGSIRDKREAIKQLAVADPSKLADRELHGEIARAVLQQVEAGRDSRNGDAIKALAVWGGKFSVPKLVELLHEEKGRGLASKALIDALTTHPTPEGAEAVARYVGSFLVHDEACHALVEMGSVAEDAVMAIAPSNNAKVSLSAIIILGEIGTDKSVPLLRKAQRSRNERVKQAAVAAIQKVSTRTGTPE